jgi:propanol-preferring alcohol dehydrogenase
MADLHFDDMKAVRFNGPGRPAELVLVPRPLVGPGQLLLKIAGAGVCHSDLHVLDEGVGPLAGFTLGHENAGWVEEVGEGVTGWRTGDTALVYGAWGCGRCHTCQQGAENYCENSAALGGCGGLGFDGGMAEYMLVPTARFLLPLGNLDPRRAAPLAGAALTPYHAIKKALPALGPGATALVIGLGGLGQMAVQLLHAVSAARVVAADIDETKLRWARELGADAVVNPRDAGAADAARAACGPGGVRVVFDCVGSASTAELAVKVVGTNSHIYVIGHSGGAVKVGPRSLPFGCQVEVPYWGSRSELMEVVALAQSGLIEPEIEFFRLDEALEVFARLRRGQIRGRAVLTPHG